jgi:hypothetical protein
MLPFLEKKIDEERSIRVFSSDLGQDDLYWHKDKEDRVISKKYGEDWYYQEDNSLPVLISSKPIFIKKNTWHRILMGSSDLVIEVNKLNK